MTYNKEPKQLDVDTDSADKNEQDMFGFPKFLLLESLWGQFHVKIITIHYRKRQLKFLGHTGYLEGKSDRTREGSRLSSRCACGNRWRNRVQSDGKGISNVQSLEG